MKNDNLKKNLELRELELNSLLEVTQAINNNMAEESLYKIYGFTLRANLQVKKLALFVYDDEWLCKVNFGTELDCFEIPMPKQFLKIKDIYQIVEEDVPYNEFDYLIPVHHKNELLAVIMVSGLSEDANRTNSAVNFLQAISNIIIVAIENKKLARKQLQQEALRKELEIASDVQQFLFPNRLPYGVGLKIEASYLPHDRIGGDYYDYIAINQNQFLICIADVSGKGIPAALIMSNFQASLRTLVRQTGNLREIVNELNYQVFENAKGEKFITFFAAIYDHKLKSLAYVNAGHNPPLLINNDGSINLLEDGTTVIGAMEELPFLNEGFLTNLDDFTIFAYTDGLTETANPQGEEYGQERLLKYFELNGKKELRDIHQDIIINLDEFKETEKYNDDITLLSCKVKV